MRRIGVKLVVIATVVVVLGGCFDPFSGTDPENSATSNLDSDYVPQMEINDVARSVGAATFETIVSIDVDLMVRLYSLDGVEQLIADRPVLVSIADDGGNTVINRRVLSDGSAQAVFSVPTATPYVTLTISGPGIVSRVVEITDPVSLETISREIDVLVETIGSIVALEVVDSDGDGIPDDRDAFPNDATQAFRSVYPVSGNMFVGYEDNFPSVGDGDYNDFLASYNITEITDGQNRVVQIIGVFNARARAAGWDHEFGVIINFPGAVGNLYYEQRNSTGALVRSESRAVSDSVRVVVFENTKQAFDRPGGVKPDNAYPDQQDSVGHNGLMILSLSPATAGGEYQIDAVPYDPYLFVHNTQLDVHLIGRPSFLTVQENPWGNDGYIDADGYPRGLLVPADWGHPIEVTPIEAAYPEFALWRADLEQGILTGPHNDWYLDPVQEHIVPVP